MTHDELRRLASMVLEDVEEALWLDCNARTEECAPINGPDSPEAHAHDKKLTDADRAGMTSIKPRRSHRMRGWIHSE